MRASPAPDRLPASRGARPQRPLRPGKGGWRAFCHEGCAAWVLGALVLSACGGEPVPFEIVFPSQETFLMSETGSVSVYVPVDQTPDEICRNLSSGLPAGDGQNVSTTGLINICSFLGDVQLTGVPTGRLVFFAEVRGGPLRGPILSGCTVADVDVGTTEPVRIQLSTLPTYPELEVICANIDAKCPADPSTTPAQCIPE